MRECENLTTDAGRRLKVASTVPSNQRVSDSVSKLFSSWSLLFRPLSWDCCSVGLPKPWHTLFHLLRTESHAQSRTCLSMIFVLQD